MRVINYKYSMLLVLLCIHTGSAFLNVRLQSYYRKLNFLAAKFAYDDDKDIPPPPKGLKGEFSDWDNENYLEDDIDDIGTDSFFSVKKDVKLPLTSDGTGKKSDFEEGWSEEPPYFDENDIDDDDYVSDKYSSFPEPTENAKPTRLENSVPSIPIVSPPFIVPPIASLPTNILSSSDIRNIMVDQNTILELKLQTQLMKKDQEYSKNIANISSKISNLYIMLAVSLFLNALALHSK